MAILLDGKSLRDKKILGFKNRINILESKGFNPSLVVIQVGDDPASSIYINGKKRIAENIGIIFKKINMQSNTSYDQLKNQIEKLNNDKEVNAILLQLPLPSHLSGYNLTTLIDPNKDADGLSPFNQGINASQHNMFAPIPCTANGIMEFFKEYNIPIEGKQAVVFGRSNIVGRPISHLLEQSNATVSILHSRTTSENVKYLVKNADIIIMATGQKDLIKPTDVKDGVVIIDVGIIRLDNGKLRGDVLYREFMDKASYITPVPGGVGPMTITMLMENVISLTENLMKEKEIN